MRKPIQAQVQNGGHLKIGGLVRPNASNMPKVGPDQNFVFPFDTVPPNAA